jgi:hypothetical protein
VVTRSRLLKPKPLAVVLAALVLMISVAGCVSMPSGGPVLPYEITQGSGADSQHYLQFVPQSPEDGWDPAQIVQGFITASASFTNGQQVAREYLTQDASRLWVPLWSANVFTGDGPHVSDPVYPDAPQSGAQSDADSGDGRGKAAQPTTATVTVSGTLQARLSSYGNYYAVPSGSGTEKQGLITFHLAKVGGQWRIAEAPPDELLLTGVEFAADYQLRNLYFIDPTGQFLIPDPVYVPLQATPEDLMSGLVEDLIHQPQDWLSGGARSAFPTTTKLLGNVGLTGGLATVNLGGGFARASNTIKEQASAQLVYTLSGSGQGQPNVTSTSVYVDGKVWASPKSPGNVVQNIGNSALSVPQGTSAGFYYLDAKGNVWLRKGTGGAPAKVQNIGTGFSSIAVSPDGRYLAALRGGTLYTGAIGQPLVKRQGSGYSSMSWDPNDNLWTVMGGEVDVLRGDVTSQGAQSAAGEPVTVNVLHVDGDPVSGQVKAVRVAPDGVRMALVVDDAAAGGTGATTVDFGAIAAASQSLLRQDQPTVMDVTVSPFYVSSQSVNFSSVSWYGADNVITLGSTPGVQGAPVLTEYSVNGGSSSPVSSDANITSLTTSYGSELVAAAKDGVLLADASTSGAWANIPGGGLAPAYPG